MGPPHDKEQLEVSGFGFNFKATGDIARKSLPLLTFLVLSTMAFYLASNRIVQRLENVDKRLDSIEAYLRPKPKVIAKAPKPVATLVASRP
jgi:hypothetical protein